MPFNQEHIKFIAKEKDGSKSIYCSFCYKDGEFLNPAATLNETVELGVSQLAKKIGEKAAREHLSQFLPTLARWKRM